MSKRISEYTIDGQYTVYIEKSRHGRFNIVYGMQKTENLAYDEAAKEFGQCVFHALTCAGLIDVP